MNDVISEYQKWKEQGQNLRGQARQAMETRFRELLSEAVQIAEEYRADFGGPLKPPSPVTAFRYKASGRAKAKKAAKPAKPSRVVSRPQPAAAPDPKVAGLQKRLANARKKLDDAKAKGAPTQNLEDRIYELEDEIRLNQAK